MLVILGGVVTSKQGDLRGFLKKKKKKKVPDIRFLIDLTPYK